ncbi:MAG: pimeloyl-ACP methyl ester carboxylesterase [Kiritimatiellia bacterium]|jgi:pimeloyl-ACP methyl ester carboxylesterase
MTERPLRERDLHTGPRGLRLRLCEWGSPAGIPILILHGFLEQGAAWHEVAQNLGPRHIVAPDHRGHGRSQHVGEGGFYHFWDYVADVQAIVQKLGGQVDLVGHSMGGSIAALYSSLRPETVRRLVLIEGLGPPDRLTVAHRQTGTFLRHMAAPPQHTPMRDLDEAVSRMRRVVPVLPISTARRMAERATRATDDGLEWSWDALHRARSPQAFSAELFGTYLSQIESPTLLIDGGASPWLRMIPDLEQRQSKLHSHARVVLQGHGHHPHHTCPAQLAAHILEHLDA